MTPPLEEAQRDAHPWYKDAVIYQLHVRSFQDGNGDGIGDFRGLTKRLDYVQELGVTAIWLLPFYPSPLKDDGYDIADYTSIHPTYGTMRDFKAFLREAHRRDLRVITELVLNHTSDQHEWFQQSRRAEPGSRWREYYVWSDTPEKYRDTRIIFRDFEPSNWTWDPVAKAYFWHRFYSHQPDLNYDNPDVLRAVCKVLDFWLELGVDGLRLDAVPYLYEREGTNCENLPETHAALKELRRHVAAGYDDRMLLAEANQWPEEAVEYFGDGDECHTAFHFPLMPRMFMAVRMEDRFPIIDILEQTPEIPESCQWILFLRNHDELTLEMVTDAERDYMYRAYAQDQQMRINLGIRRRLAPLLGNDRRRIELMNGLLLALPGTPVIYYGDELGMGDNVYLGDRNGVRTPMQWNSDRNAGFSPANPQKLYLPVVIDPEHHYETINVETQHSNPHSLLWWMRRLIALRKQFKAFGRGRLEFLTPENPKVLAFVRRDENESLLVVANLSRFAQHVELDLSSYQGMLPVELFGGAAFPTIQQLAYPLTLGPHGFYWFGLQKPPVELPAPMPDTEVPLVETSHQWEAILSGQDRGKLETVLPDFLKTRRWFGGKARAVRSVRLADAIPCGEECYITLVDVAYRDGEPETYVLPITCARGDAAKRVLNHQRPSVIARLRLGENEEPGVLYDATSNGTFCNSLLQRIAERRRMKGSAGDLVTSTTRAFKEIWSQTRGAVEGALAGAEQSNTSIVYEDRLILKLFRHLEHDVNPDLEIGRFLTEKAGFAHVPPVAGAIEYRRPHGEPMSVAILHGYVPNEGDAWQYTLDALGRYFERVVTLPAEALLQAPTSAGTKDLEAADLELPPLAYETIGPYLQAAETLGTRTAQLHAALATGTEEKGLCPEPFSAFYQRSLYQALRNSVSAALQLLRNRVKQLPASLIPEATRLLELEGEIKNRLRAVLEAKISALRIRCHGDYHLGQVLYTGNDFVIMDFEGEPARSLAERRLKGSPLRDVAGMLRSFHYAAYAALLQPPVLETAAPQWSELMEAWAAFWYRWIRCVYLNAYAQTAQGAPFMPQGAQEQRILLDAFLLEKALYELAYELNNRPDWVRAPLRGCLALLEPSE